MLIHPQATQLNFSILEIIQHIIISQMWKRGEILFEIGDPETNSQIFIFILRPPTFLSAFCKPSQLPHLLPTTQYLSLILTLFLIWLCTVPLYSSHTVLGWNFLREGIEKYTSSGGLNLLRHSSPKVLEEHKGREIDTKKGISIKETSAWGK